MAVYVDDMEADFGRMKMCHMIADFDEELHAMADAIGVQRKWFQGPPNHDAHYDIALSKVKLAVKHGAVRVTLRQLAAMNMVRRTTGFLPDPKDAEAEMKGLFLANPNRASLLAEVKLAETMTEHVSAKPEKIVYADDGPTCRVLIDMARRAVKQGTYSDREGTTELLVMMADKLQWFMKGYGVA
jgi:hypothetical protein